MNAETLQQSIRQSYEEPGLIARLKALGYQITMHPEYDTICLAAPSGIGLLLDRPEAYRLMRQIDAFYTKIKDPAYWKRDSNER